MSVDRLSKKALQKILSGQVREESTCVIKFYANNCPLCHNLKDEYENIASNYESVYFFAFNIADYPHAEKLLNFSGVPTISMIKTGGTKPKIRVLKDPEDPYRDMWYNPKDIVKFIEKEK